MTLYDAAASFTRLYPIHPDTRSGGTWAELCALLMARFGLAPGGVGWAVEPRAYGNAIDQARDSGPLNANPGAAPVGAFHYWNWGTFGHVGVDLNGHGTDVFMASSYLRDSWGDDIGLNSVTQYSNTNRAATYLGWADNYRGGKYNLAGTASNGSTPLQDGFLMALSDQQQNDLADEVRATALAVADIQSRVRGTDPNVDMLQSIQGAAVDVQKRVYAPGGQYDYFQLFASNLSAILAALAQHPQVELDPAQIPLLAASLKAGLGDEVAKALAAALAKGTA